MRPTLVYKKPGRIAANFESHIHNTVYTPQKIHGLFYTVRKFKLIRCHSIYNNNHFVNWQVVIDGLDRMGWYVDKVLCLGDVFKETLNSYTSWYLIYHSISTLQDEWQGISHTTAGMHILILWLFSWFIHMWPSRDDHQLNDLQFAKNDITANQYPSLYSSQETIATVIFNIFILFRCKSCPLFVMISEASVADAKLASLALW